MSNKRTGAAVLSVAANGLLIAFKVAVGVLTGSVSVISEAIHSGIDLLASVIALVAVRASSQEADKEHPYGHGKFENISGTIEALLIFAAAAWIIYEAVRKLLHPQSIDMAAWGVGVMLVSALANALVGRRLSKTAKATESVALQADATHHWTDVYTSAGVAFGLLVIWVGRSIWPGANLGWLDPAVAIAVALMILKTAWDLTRESARDLMDVSLPEADVDWIAGFVKERWPAVRSFHNLRTRKAGSNRFIDFHAVVNHDMSVGDAHTLGDEIVVAIKERLPDSRIHIHVEPCDYECGDSCTTGCSVPPEERGAQRAARAPEDSPIP